jgi:hypothetical protein
LTKNNRFDIIIQGGQTFISLSNLCFIEIIAFHGEEENENQILIKVVFHQMVHENIAHFLVHQETGAQGLIKAVYFLPKYFL